MQRKREEELDKELSSEEEALDLTERFNNLEPIPLRTNEPLRLLSQDVNHLNLDIVNPSPRELTSPMESNDDANRYNSSLQASISRTEADVEMGARTDMGNSSNANPNNVAGVAEPTYSERQQSDTQTPAITIATMKLVSAPKDFCPSSKARGTKKRLEKFVDDWERCLKLSSWPSTRRQVETFSGYLKGVAKNWWEMEIDTNQILDGKMAAQKLVERFQDDDYDVDLVAKVEKIKQKRKESAQVFFNRISTMVIAEKKKLGSLKQGVEKRLCEVAIRKLSPSEPLKGQLLLVMDHNPNLEWKRLIQHVTELTRRMGCKESTDSSSDSSGSSSESSDSSEEEKRKTKKKGKKKSEKKVNKKSMDILAMENMLKSQIGQLRSDNAKEMNQFKDQWVSSVTEMIANITTCYHCQQDGHIRRNCPILKAGMAVKLPEKANVRIQSPRQGPRQDARNDPPKCERCGMTGHRANQCEAPKCFNCSSGGGRVFHYSGRCPKRGTAVQSIEMDRGQDFR